MGNISIFFAVLTALVVANVPKYGVSGNRVEHFRQSLWLSRVKRETLSESVACIRTQAVVDDRLSRMSDESRKQFADEFEFDGDNKVSLQLAWTGNDTERIIVVTSEDGMSTCYLSDDMGKKFLNISSRLGSATTDHELILQKHPIDPKTAYITASELLASTSSLYITVDAGSTFTPVQLPYLMSDSFIFHPTDQNLIISLDQTQGLFISKDKGFTWKNVKTNVVSCKWSTVPGSTDIYVVTNPDGAFFFLSTPSVNNVLEKSTDLGQNWKTVYKNIYTFGLGGKFLYVSAYESATSIDQRKLLVSTDGGTSWNGAKLPTITPDRFYSILDATEGQIFLHVDDPGNTGQGTLYLSDATGIIFAKSLENHLYPNFEDLTDFYVVQSMRGVYVASQLSADNSIHTVISYNRGGEWQPIKRPEGVPCTDETKHCSLHIHNLYSIKRGVKANVPLSLPNAVGLILVHGHVAESLQTTDPDVFVSSDGGYTWRFALKGPHHYQIADNGGLLVAIPADTPTPSIIKFSTDEGRCWISYNYTHEREPIQITGLLVEPGNKAMTVAIWGYTSARVWHTHIINFTAVIDRQCGEGDYEDWVAHVHNNDAGCLLGAKETFRRLKADTWCYNGKAFNITKTVVPCPCTSDDYDCDFGYMRQAGTEICVRDPTVPDKEISICHNGHEDKFVPLGYHKIPGDACKGGFVPPESKIVDLSEACGEDYSDLSSLSNAPGPEKKQARHSAATVIVPILVVGLVIFAAVLVTLWSRKYRHRISYHYMSIKSEDRPIMNGANSTSLFEQDSDDEGMLH